MNKEKVINLNAKKDEIKTKKAVVEEKLIFQQEETLKQFNMKFEKKINIMKDNTQEDVKILLKNVINSVNDENKPNFDTTTGLLVLFQATLDFIFLLEPKTFSDQTDEEKQQEQIKNDEEFMEIVKTTREVILPALIADFTTKEKQLKYTDLFKYGINLGITTLSDKIKQEVANELEIEINNKQNVGPVKEEAK